jgi:hypothetical protein
MADRKIEKAPFNAVRTSVLAVSGATSLGDSDCGRLIAVTAGAYNINLPAAKQGRTVKFLLAAGSTDNMTITVIGDDHLMGRVAVTSTTADNTGVGQIVADISGALVELNIDSNSATLGGSTGDVIDLYCNVDGTWIVNAHLLTTAANPGTIAVMTA